MRNPPWTSGICTVTSSITAGSPQAGVADSQWRIIALTGPAGDHESEQLADQIALLPELVAALQEIVRLADANTHKSSDLITIRAYAIANAREVLAKVGK